MGIFVCCLIVGVLPPPTGKTPFAVQFNSIQFNSIYLCAKLNSHRPITKLAQVVKRRRRRRRRSKALEELES
jgi:hypothetical protein